MTDEVDAMFAQFGGAARVLLRRGVFAEVRSGVAWVDMGESRFACDFGSGYVPRVGDTVQVLTVDDRHMLFPARALPGVGTVQTIGSGQVTVETTAGMFTMPYVGTAPTSGQLVGLSWSEQPFVIGPLSVQPEAPLPVPDPGAGQVRSATFQVVDTGSHNVGSSNYWQAQPWASDSTFGGWFYGTQISDTIPASAEFVSLEFYVSWQSRYGGQPNFGLHGLPWKSGQLSFTNVQPWAPAAGWQTPPNAATWFAALKAGGGRSGIGLSHGGWNKFSSRAQDSMSGALRISWRS